MTDPRRALRDPGMDYLTFQLWLNKHLRRRNSFVTYRSEFLRHAKLDIADLILNHAIEKGCTNVGDFGCGIGKASEDFFPVLSRRIAERGLNQSLVDSIHYFGVDLNVEERATDGITLVQGDLQDWRWHGKLPKIHVGVSYFTVPYIDRKLEALASMTAVLDGTLLIYPYYGWQIEGHRVEPTGPAHDTLVLPTRFHVPQHVTFRESQELGFLYYGEPRGQYFGQRVSIYKESSPSRENGMF
jgi:hypothetical protein